MSHAILAMGAPAKKIEAVTEEVKALGLSLIRASPSDVTLDVTNDYIQPGHAVFKHYLASFSMVAGQTNSISTRVPPFHPLKNKTLPFFTKMPTIIFSYGQKLSPDRIDEVRQLTGAAETYSNGKLAFKTIFSPDIFPKIMETAPSKTTASGTEDMNISSLAIYLFLHRLFHQFNLINQYPAFHTNSKEDVGTWYMGMMDYKETSNAEDLDGMEIQVAKSTAKDPNFMINCNLPVPISSYRYNVSSHNDIPTTDNGLILPYVKYLTKTDYSTVPRVIHDYFMGFLGIDATQALMFYDVVKKDFGPIAKTGWGDELAHMFKCVDVAMRTQCYLKVIAGPSMSYGGCILFGGMYTIQHGATLYRSVSRTEILKALDLALPHSRSLQEILALTGKTTADAQAMAKTIMKMSELSFVLRDKGITEANKIQIVKLAHMLTFDNLDYLSPTAHNVSRVLIAINDHTISEHAFPLHPLAVLSQSRSDRLLSSFGPTIPSFVVPGGKKMSLDGNFTVREKKGDEMNDRDIHKIGMMMVPFKQGVEDFQKVKTEKSVYNPYGNSLGSRISTQSVIRTFEKESAMSVLSSLRKAVGASNVVSRVAEKRALEDAADGSASKRARDELFSF